MVAEFVPADALEHLLDFLHARNILISKDDIGWAFTSPKTASEVTDFVCKQINEENLLTLEEKEILERLKSQLPDIEKVPYSVLPKNERQIRRDVEHLEDATAQLKRQNDALRKQKMILKKMHETKNNLQQSHSRITSARKRKYDGEKSQLTIAMEDVLADTRNIQRQERYAYNNPVAIAFQTSKINESLKADDRLLERVQNLILSTVIPNQAAMENLIEHVRQLSAKLTELKTCTIQTKLDRIFIEQTKKHDIYHANVDNDKEKERTHLDLNSFYHDIPDVSDMVTKEVFLRPITMHVKKLHQKKVHESAARFEMITSILLQLSEKNIGMRDLLRRDCSRSIALEKILEKIKFNSSPASNLMLTKVNGARSKGGGGGGDARLSGRLVTAAPSTPMRKTKTDENDLPQSHGLALQILRSLDISEHHLLTKSTEQRSQKLHEQEMQLSSSTIEKISQIEADVGSRLDRLDGTVWSDTKWMGGEPNLFDQDLKKKLVEIDTSVRRVGQDVAGISKELVEMRDEGKSVFVDRWIKD